MKKCPFCAEEIQDAAIKCRFCGSMLDGSAPAPAADPDKPAAAKSLPQKLMPVVEANKMIYDGSPSWKAYLGQYLLVGFLAIAVVLIVPMVRGAGVSLKEKTLEVVVPLALAALVYFGIGIYRRSLKFRVTTTSIEIERGILARRINVIQLWRIKDVVYRQNLVDRILQIAHIEVLSQDDLIKDLEIFGMPASRQLFEQLRDSIEIQRQAKNVIGVVS